MLRDLRAGEPASQRVGAAPALSAVAAALRNEDNAISREGVDAVRAFMTDGIDSPLYGRDPLAARRAADALRRRLVAAEAAQRGAVLTAA